MIPRWQYFSLLLLQLLLGVQAQTRCTLCANPTIIPQWMDFKLLDGRTCKEVYLNMPTMFVGNPQCQVEKDYAQDLCCSATEPPPFDFAPTAAPVYHGPVGSEPDCPICGTMEYPGIPSAFIVARYVGDYSCAQLYQRGLNGLIPWFMCGPLQDFAEPVCGCGQYNPDCIENPTQCYGYTFEPTRAPVNAPTPPDTPTPTAAPVYVEPTFSNRKVPPQGGKYGTKMSTGRGGAAGGVRGGRMLEEDGLPEIESVETGDHETLS